MEYVKDITLQLLLVLIPWFLYFFFWKDRPERGNDQEKWRIALLLSAATVLCMSFPVRLSEGYVADLRFILLALAFLYGGKRVGLIVLAVIIVARYLQAKAGFPFLLLGLPPHLIPLWYLSSRFRNYSQNKRKAVALVHAVWASLIGLFMFLLQIRIHVLDASIYPKIDFFWGYSFMYFVGMLLSITLIEAYRDSLDLRRELQRNEKLSSLGELAASIAHEIRNPLTATNGFLQLLKANPRSAKTEEYLNIALDELDRAESIISEYLSFAKPQIERTEKVRVRETVEAAVRIAQSYASMKCIHLIEDFQASAREAVVMGDPVKLGQCLINILKNAVEASPESGDVRVALAVTKEEVHISVEDRGLGMTEEEIDRLGSPFYSTKTDGTGLGLMVCYRMIEAMGGRIQVRSAKGTGSTFTIRLPLAA